MKGPVSLIEYVHLENKILAVSCTEANVNVKDLEMEDAGIVLREALIWRNHSVQQFVVHCQAGDGSQQPAVTCKQQIHELYKHFLKSCSCHISKPQESISNGR